MKSLGDGQPNNNAKNLTEIEGKSTCPKQRNIAQNLAILTNTSL
ncbi:hypothetical protein T01_11293 [Trichinella spiralis]|uniref:Uncharacterized protein n=1 Tax=Trichinella spiralis TaxID=6334 RepID=A0A0V0Z0C8_TRISP|nr:hypothetical protein T01_11293 [Trichinella spiralis]